MFHQAEQLLYDNAQFAQANSTLFEAEEAYQHVLDRLSFGNKAPLNLESARRRACEKSYLLGKLSLIALQRFDLKRAKNHAHDALAFSTVCPDAWHVLGVLAQKARQTDAALHAFSQALNAYEFVLESPWSRFLWAAQRSWTHYSLYELASSQRLPQGVRLNRYTQLVLSFTAYTFGQGMDSFYEKLGYGLQALKTGIVACFKPNNWLELTKKLTERYGGVAYLSYLVGQSYRETGHTDEAILWLNRALQRDPLNENCRLALGNLLEEQGELDHANTMYEALYSLSPLHPAVVCNMANIALKQHRFIDALSHYQAAIDYSLNDTSLVSWRSKIALCMANIYQTVLKDFEAAKATLRMALAWSNPATDNQYAELHCQLGLLYFETQEFAHAKFKMAEALTFDATNVQLLANMGYMHWQDHETEEAIRKFEQAIIIDPQYDIAYNNLGVIYLEQYQDLSKAQHLFCDAIRLNPSYTLAYYNLGRVHDALGETCEAAECFYKALQLAEHHGGELDRHELEERIRQLFEKPEQYSKRRGFSSLLWSDDDVYSDFSSLQAHLQVHLVNPWDTDQVS